MMELECRDIHTRWMEYLYLEMDEPQQSLFIQHLKHCPGCCDEEKKWRALLSRFDTLALGDGTTEVPPDLVYHVKRQIHFYEDWRKQTFSQFRNRIAGAAALLLFLFLGIWYGNSWLQNQDWRMKILKPITAMLLNSSIDSNTLSEYFSNREYDPASHETQKINAKPSLEILAGGMIQEVTPAPIHRLIKSNM